MTENSSKKALPEVIRELRAAMNVSQGELAIKHLGKSLTMVQRYERGDNVAVSDLATMARLARERNLSNLGNYLLD